MQTFLTILPLIIIALTGYICVRVKLFNKSQIDSLSAICFNLLIPLFLFKTTYQTNLDIGISYQWFLSFYIPVIFSYITVYLLYKFGFKLANKKASLRALSATYSNTVLVAIPIIATYLPAKTAGLAFIVIAFHSAILFSLTEFFVNKSILSSFKKSLQNPIVLSILGGFIVNLLNLKIPELLLEPFVALSKSAIPLALFGLGAAMYFLPIRGNLTTAFSFALFKLLALPAFAFVTCRYGFNLNEAQTLITVLLIASPTGVGAYVMATKHNAETDIAASTVVISTLLCTVSYLFWLEILI